MSMRVVPLTDLAHAEGVKELFLTVYGTEYPIALYYDPPALLAAQDHTVCCVALDQADHVVGHLALYNSSPGDSIKEIGAGLVAKEARSSGVLGQMAIHLIKAAKERGLPLLFGEAVCNHIFSQKSMGPLGFKESALEINLMPAEAYTKEASATGRVSAVLAFRPVADDPSQVALPTRYTASLRRIYDSLKLERTFQSVDRSEPTSAGTYQSTTIDIASLERVLVQSVGSDLTDALPQGGELGQLMLPLDIEHLEFAVETAHKAGFFYGGLLPRWCGVDCLLMQRPTGAIDWEAIQLYSEEAKAVLVDIRADFETLPS